MSKKQIIISIISLLVIVGITVPIIVFSIPKDPIINDLTDNASQVEDVLSEGVVDNHAEAILSPNISLYDAEESKTIESSILSVSQVDTNLVLDVNKGSPMESLEKGDVFFIQGTTDSFLGEAYFGKVSSKIEQDGYYTYAIETPMIDEVFDYIDIDTFQNMSYDNISSIDLAEGANITSVSDISTIFDASESLQAGSVFGNPTNSIQLLSTTSLKSNTEINNKNIVITFEYDILKLLQEQNKVSSDKKTEDDNRKVTQTEAGNILVYITDYGVCYHKWNCSYLYNSKQEIFLDKATSDGYKACTLCEPQYISDETTQKDKLIGSELKLNLKIGLENLSVNILGENEIWNVKDGFEDLTIQTTGNFIASAGLSANAKINFDGDKTKIVVPGWGDSDLLSLEGLNEKLFPIAYITWECGAFVVKDSPQKADTPQIPISIGILIYTDICGNVSIGAEANISFSKKVECNFDVFKDGNYLGDLKFEDYKTECDYGLKAELKADVDVQVIGASLMLYAGNMNVMEFSIVRTGLEAEGVLGFDSRKIKTDEHGFYAKGKARSYIQMFELNLKFKAKANWMGWLGKNHSLQAGINLNSNLGPYIDLTIWVIGDTSEKSTYFNSSTMYVNNIVAQDSETLYYKGENGNLIAEKDSYKTTIYAEDFFVICGIDDSYIYILKQSENNSSLYDMYRIQKDGTSERRIVEGIKNFMECDESYFYYTLGDDTYTIVRFDRSTLEAKEIASFDAEVAYVNKQNDNLYVETLSGYWFFTTIKYYLIDTNGNILEEYGENPSVSQYMLKEYDNFIMATKIMSNGFLRDTASEICWLSKDKTTYVTTVPASETGWNYSNAGIFVLQEGGENATYKMILYKAENGQTVEMTEVNSKYALFTIAQDDYGTWYFMDEIENGLILCSMDKDFGTVKILETFEHEKFPVEFGNCTMFLLDNTIWFYEVINENTANVIYRYSLY